MSSIPPTPESNRGGLAAGARVGVLGAGQLGRMLALAGIPLGARFLFVDPSPGAPASAVGEQLVADYTDPRALEALAACDVVTYEFESVPVEAAEAVAARTRVFPSPSALRVAQDRLHEKTCFRDLGVATPDFVAVDDLAGLEAGARSLGFPCVLKTRRLGYDGKGQRVLRGPDDVAPAWAALGAAPLLLEAFVPFDRELSLLGVRGRDGATRFYPLVHNEHRDGILRVTWAPARGVDPALAAEAERCAALLLERLDYVGVLALELFEQGGRLSANEMAPRVHNSGHFSIEGALTSQFENHVRAVLGLPLGETAVPRPAAMLNLIGDLPDPAAALAVPGTHAHFYGKAPRRDRKVGHLTVTAPDVATLEARVAELRALAGAG